MNSSVFESTFPKETLEAIESVFDTLDYHLDGKVITAPVIYLDGCIYALLYTRDGWKMRKQTNVIAI